MATLRGRRSVRCRLCVIRFVIALVALLTADCISKQIHRNICAEALIMNESSVDSVSTDSLSELTQLKPESVKMKAPVEFQLLTDHINANCSNETNLNFVIGKNNIVQTSYVAPLQPSFCIQKENQVYRVKNKEILNIENIPLRLCNLNGEVMQIESKSENKIDTVKVIDNEPLQFTTIPLCPASNQLQIQNDVPDIMK